MKEEKKIAIFQNLMADGNWANDGTGQAYRKDAEKHVWLRRNGVSGRQDLQRDLKRLGASVTAKDATAIFEEVRDSADFLKAQLAGESPSTLLACKDGIIDLTSGELIEPEDDQFVTTYVDFRYIKDAKFTPQSTASQFFSVLLGEKEMMLPSSSKMKALMEMMVYAISKLPNAKKAFILLGPPNIGKSVLLNFLGRLLGPEGYTSLNWKNLTDKYHEALIQHCRAVLSDEMPCQPLTKLDLLKFVISGGFRVAEAKYGKLTNYRATSTLISAANNLPALGEPDAGGAFAERLQIIPMGEHPVEQRDPNLVDTLWEERDVICSMAVATAPELIKHGMAFTETDEMKALRREFSKSANALDSFLNTHYVREINGRVCIQALFDEYSAFCEEEFMTPLKKPQFRNNLRQMGFKFGKARTSSYPNPVWCVVGLSPKESAADDKAEETPAKS